MRAATWSSATAMVVAMLVALGATLTWYAYFANLFPLSEFRDWLTFYESPVVTAQSVNNLVFRITTYSRDLPLLYVGWMSRVCGSSIGCVNFFAALPVLLASGVLFFMTRLLMRSYGLAAMVVSLWMLSLPMLDAMAWQATVLDRVGLLFCFLGLWLTWRLPVANSLRQAFVFSALFLLLTFAALNSKEAYWFTPIAITIAYVGRAAVDVLDRRHYDRRALIGDARVRLALIALLPLILYSLWFALKYVTAIPFNAGWQGHVAGGVMSEIWRIHLSNLLGPRWIARTVIVVIMSFLAYASMSQRFSRHDRLLSAWLLLLLVMAYAPTARARSASPYYMLPVLAMLCLSASFVISRLRVLALHRTAQYTSAALLVLLFVVGETLSLQQTAAKIALARRDNSQMFIASHVNAAAVTSALDKRQVCYQVSSIDPHPHLYVDSPRAYPILRWAATPAQAEILKTIPVRFQVASPLTESVTIESDHCDVRRLSYLAKH